MTTRPTALIVGAGIGGIATAGRLARSGYDVMVLEKNAVPGGRCNQILHDGHRFDVGPSLFLMPEVYAETYTALGERMEDHLDLRRIVPTYHIYFEDEVRLALTPDINHMQGPLEAIEKGSFGGFLRYMVEGHQHYTISVDRFVGRNFYSLLEYFSLGNLPLLFKLKALVKHYSNIGRYFQDPHLKAAFTFQNMYLGLSPFEAPATFSLLQYTELADGVWFPLGGMYRITQSLVAIAERHGARFEYNAPVKQVEVEGSRATGVVLEDGRRFQADVVIVNEDLPMAYRHLLPDKDLGEKMNRKKFTCSAIMFYWCTDKVYSQLAHHNVFLGGDYRASFDRIFHDLTLPDQPSFYIHCPAHTDPSAAPAGRDTLMVLVPVGYINEEREQDWESLRQRARATVLHRLNKELGINDLDEHITHVVSYTPRDWLSLYNLGKGAAFGLSHNFMQVGYLRPHNRHDRYRNLYFVGASTHPGTGVPIVLLSARLVTERILKELPVPGARK